jgi:hypothetical protein
MYDRNYATDEMARRDAYAQEQQLRPGAIAGTSLAREVPMAETMNRLMRVIGSIDEAAASNDCTSTFVRSHPNWRFKLTIATIIIKDAPDNQFTVEGSLDRPEAIQEAPTPALIIASYISANAKQVSDDAIAWYNNMDPSNIIGAPV